MKTRTGPLRRAVLAVAALVLTAVAPLGAAGPDASFSVLVEDMERNYSYFAHRGIDWRALTARYRERATAAQEPATFVTVVKEMLAELKDLHVWVQPPGGSVQPTYTDVVESNYDFRAVAGQLKTCRQIGKIALVGRTAEGYGYVAVGSLQGEDALFQELDRETVALLDAPGLLVDLRANGGGDERRAQALAGLFAAERRVYARSQVRCGPRPGDLKEQPARVIEPRPGTAAFARPIVCLIGRRCMSSGEAFALMMRVLPQVTMVGQPTRGASGNPAPIALPNGVTVYYSRWVSLFPDGTVLEGKGVVPDVAVEHQGAGDPTFAAAVRELTRRVEAAPAGPR